MQNILKKKKEVTRTQCGFEVAWEKESQLMPTTKQKGKKKKRNPMWGWDMEESIKVNYKPSSRRKYRWNYQICINFT